MLHPLRHPRALASVLAVLLLFSLIPSTVLAAELLPDAEQDLSLRGLNDAFYSAFTELIQNQDSSPFFGVIQLTLGEKRLSVDGAEITMEAAPELHGGRTMLPIRAVAEAAGMTVDWDNDTRTVIIQSPWGDEIRSTIGSDCIVVNGVPSQMDVYPYIQDGSSFFPVRAISEALSLDVGWDGETGTVTLTAPWQTARLTVLSESDPTDILSDAGLSAQAILSDALGMWVLQFDTPTKAKQAAAFLQNGNPPLLVEPDIYIMTESTQSDTIFQTKTESWGVQDCQFYAFRDVYSARFQQTERITVAVVDTGVDATHPALRGRVLHGRDFVENDNDPQDVDSHGTHVAPTILDCVGDAPVDILPIRVVTNNGVSYLSLLAEGIRYAAQRYAKVINISLGGVQTAAHESGVSSLQNAVQYALKIGAVVVISAGNDAADTVTYCPANLEFPGVVVVTAGNTDHQRWQGSNYGKSVDLIAPGTEIIGAIPGGKYASKTGTSMAAPHVSAAAALLCLCSGGTIKPDALESILCTATETDSSRDPYVGYGFLDISAADVPPYRPPAAMANELMSDRIIADEEDAQDYPAFGGEYLRREISTVTFCATLDALPQHYWDVSKSKDGSVLAWVIQRADGLYDLFLAANGIIGAPEDCSSMFRGYCNVTQITMDGNLDTRNTIDVSQMFYNCYNLELLDLTGLDLSNVTDFSGIVVGTDSLSEDRVTGIGLSKLQIYNSIVAVSNTVAESDSGTALAESVPGEGNSTFSLTSVSDDVAFQEKPHQMDTSEEKADESDTLVASADPGKTDRSSYSEETAGRSSDRGDTQAPDESFIPEHSEVIHYNTDDTDPPINDREISGTMNDFSIASANDGKDVKEADDIRNVEANPSAGTTQNAPGGMDEGSSPDESQNNPSEMGGDSFSHEAQDDSVETEGDNSSTEAQDDPADTEEDNNFDESQNNPEDMEDDDNFEEMPDDYNDDFDYENFPEDFPYEPYEGEYPDDIDNMVSDPHPEDDP